MTETVKLECTAFEKLMLSRDYSTYPCVACLKMVVSGNIVREHFEKAVDQMFEQNPLMRARLTMLFGKPSWRVQARSDHQIAWRMGEPTPDWPTTSSIDLFAQTGVQFEVYQTEHQPTDALGINAAGPSTIFVKLHHAVADGQGGMTAIHEMWLCYNALYQGDEPPRTKREPDRLRHRNRFGLSGWKLICLLPKLSIGLAGVRQYLMRAPVPVVDHDAMQNIDQVEPSMRAISHRFTRNETIDFRKAAQRANWNLNELMAASVFVGSSEQRSSENPRTDGEWIRMMVPFSMRVADDYRHQTAANIVSCIFLDRTRSQISEPGALLQSIHHELELIKRNRLALIFIFSIWIKKVFTVGGSRTRSAIPKRCETSLVFSNLGKLFLGSPLENADGRLVAGQLKIETVEMLGPLAPWMCVTWLALQYGERQTLTLRFDSRIVEPSIACELMAATVKQLRSFVVETSA